MKELIIKSYSNGSYSYWSEKLQKYINIPSELAEVLKDRNSVKISFINHKS